MFYIGSTIREFEKRFEEHKERIAHKSKELNFYSSIPEGSQIEFRPLFNCGEVKAEDGKGGNTLKEIESIEFGYIHLLKPAENLAGNNLPFIFRI